MPFVEYSTKRKVVTLDFGVTGTDISFVAADNSINSTSTDLSGLADADYVLVAGTTNNDGWHQTDGASTATKITISTDTTIVDESAGSNISIDGYEHGIGWDFYIDFGCRSLTPSTEGKTEQATSIGGATETLFLRQEDFWEVTTGLVADSQRVYWDEFFASVLGGEEFTFDPDGTYSSQVSPETYIIDGNPKTSRESMSDYWRFSFKVRKT